MCPRERLLGRFGLAVSGRGWRPILHQMAFILFDPLQDLCLYAILCLPGYALGALFIVYSIVMGKRGADNINHDAHLYGALYGVLFILILKPSIFEQFVNTLF